MSPAAAAPRAWTRAVAWTLLLGAGLLYLRFHFGMLFSSPYGTFQIPEPDLSVPHDWSALGLILLAGVVAGAVLASAVRGSTPPAPITFAIGMYATLVVPTHVLDAAGRVSGHALLRPWLWAAAAWGTAGVLALWRRLRPPAASVPAPASWQGAWTDPLTPWLAAVALTVLALYGEGVGRTIRHGARAWDAHSYQLLVPLQWIRLQSLTEPLARQVPFALLGLEKFANPGNANVLMALPLMAGWDTLACLVQLPFAALGAWAVFALARNADASRAAALLSGLAFASAPLVVNQATVPLTDLASGALSLVAVAVVLQTADSTRAPLAPIALAGLAFGLALGTKYTAWSHLPLVALALACCRWLRSGPPGSRARALLAFAAAAALPSVFWYARNAVLFQGNPVYPLRIRILGYTLVKGTAAELMSGYWEQRMGMASRWEWLLFPFRDPAYFEESGFGALFVPFGVLGMALALAEAAALVRARDRALTPRRTLTLLTAGALFVFWFAAARTPRFNLPLVGFLAAAAAPAVDALGKGLRRHAVGAFALGLGVLTVMISVRYHGWDVGAPERRSEELLMDFPGSGGFAIPPALDTLPPSVIYNDTLPETTSQMANYNLTGADHRHLVYDHRDFVPSNPADFVSDLKILGADYVFLRLRKTAPLPDRYRTDDLRPFLTAEVEEFRSTLYRVR
jgi:hypothetical protein